ncbi:MAG: hypothetical protein HY721_28160 [Planctomycetes bacterium]|nr:hypothetical protein [Planctomycetota bacterium]
MKLTAPRPSASAWTAGPSRAVPGCPRCRRLASVLAEAARDLEALLLEGNLDGGDLRTLHRVLEALLEVAPVAREEGGP